METLNLTEDQVAVLKDMGFETAQAFLDNQLAAGVRKISQDKKLEIGEAVLNASDEIQATVADALKLDHETLEPIIDAPIEVTPEELIETPLEEIAEITP